MVATVIEENQEGIADPFQAFAGFTNNGLFCVIPTCYRFREKELLVKTEGREAGEMSLKKDCETSRRLVFSRIHRDSCVPQSTFQTAIIQD